MTPQRSGVACLALLGLSVLSCQIPENRVDIASVSAAPAGPERVADADRVEARLAACSSSLTRGEVAKVATAIRREAKRFGIAPDLVLAVIEVESSYDAFAVSPMGAVGLMQILPNTGEALAERHGVTWRGPRTLFDPVANVTLGIAYLSELRERFGPWPTALAAYNWGPSHIGRRLSEGTPIPVGYAQRVLSARSHPATTGV